MAQEKYAYEGNTAGHFADDDPLAELARIVGYEPSPSRSVAAAPSVAAPVRAPQPPASRPEPVFDLEDELLMEFERYDAPNLDPADSIPVDEPVVARHEPRVEERFTESPVPVPSHVRSQPDEDGEFSFGAVAERRQEPVAPVFDDVYFDPPQRAAEPPVEDTDTSELSLEFDLADEIEMALAPSAELPEVEAPAGNFRMPLANFHSERREPSLAPEQPQLPAFDEPSFDEPSVEVSAAAEAIAPSDDNFSFSVEPDAPVHEPLPKAQNPVRQEPEMPAFDAAVNEDEFELALDGLEIDLSDIVLTEVEAADPVMRAAPVHAPASAPVIHAVVEPAVAVPVRDVSPVAQKAVPVTTEMPFDASQIGEADYPPEAFSEVDLPEVPKPAKVEEPVFQPSFDVDFDAELAGLIEESRPPVAANVSAPVSAKAQPVEDFEEFSFTLPDEFKAAAEVPQPARVVIDPDHMEIAGPEGGRRWRTWMIGAAASVAVLASATGLYAWLSSGSGFGIGSGDGPVVIAADNTPIKMRPENPGGKTVPNQDKAVYDRVSGDMPQSPSQKALISSSEEPLDVVQRTLTPENFPLDGAEDAADDRLTPDAGSETAAAPADTADSNVSLRKVRTMIVRPDGSLVAREEPETAPASQTAAQLPASGNGKAETAPLNTQPASADALEKAAETPATSSRAPLPTQRPVEQPVNVVNTVTGAGNVRPATQEQASAAAKPATAEASSVATTTAPAGSYVIQIASLPSQAEAEKSYKNQSGKFGSVIGGRPVEIKSADIPGKGTYYRVRIVAGSKADANSLCDRLKQAGGSCLVTR